MDEESFVFFYLEKGDNGQGRVPDVVKIDHYHPWYANVRKEPKSVVATGGGKKWVRPFDMADFIAYEWKRHYHDMIRGMDRPATDRLGHAAWPVHSTDDFGDKVSHLHERFHEWADESKLRAMCRSRGIPARAAPVT